MALTWPGTQYLGSIAATRGAVPVAPAILGPDPAIGIALAVALATGGDDWLPVFATVPIVGGSMGGAAAAAASSTAIAAAAPSSAAAAAAAATSTAVPARAPAASAAAASVPTMIGR